VFEKYAIGVWMARAYLAICVMSLILIVLGWYFLGSSSEYLDSYIYISFSGACILLPIALLISRRAPPESYNKIGKMLLICVLLSALAGSVRGLLQP